MSSYYYFFNEDNPKSPFLKIKKKLDYNKWCDVMESYKNMTWDINTKHGIFYFERYGELKFKSNAFFDYIENPDEFRYVPGEAITTGKYTFFICFIKESGFARAQFFGKENKKLIPLFFEISQKLNCYLFRDGKTLITKEYINDLKKSS